MARVFRLGLALLVLSLLMAAPALAAASGTVAWNETGYRKGDTGYYSYACAGCAKCFLNITRPDGVTTSSSNASASGVNSYSLSLVGTYSVKVLNGTELDSDTTTVSIVNGIIELLDAMVNFVPDLVDLVLTFVPFMLVGALIVFLGGFVEKLLRFIR
jgi:hypothetical protein